MSYQNVFKRYEVKYLISKEQQDIIKNKMDGHMLLDQYGKSTVCSIYFDTPTYLLIRRSIEKPIYKEKLRVRGYGEIDQNSNVFVELKKKYKSVVYKRRVSMSEQAAMKYLCEGKNNRCTQITKEVDYFCEQYKGLKPAVYLSYEREAFFSKEVSDLRITFDKNILWRDFDLSLCSGAYGTSLLPKNQTLMEIKTSSAIPLWLTQTLSNNHIYKTSFSKYGNVYSAILNKKYSGGLCYAR